MEPARETQSSLQNTGDAPEQEHAPLSERQNAAHELNELHREAVFKQAAESLPEILFLYDIPTQSCLYVNRRLTLTLGFTAGEIATMGTGILHYLVHPEDIQQFAERIRRLAEARDDDVVETECRMKHADGEWRWFHNLDTVFSRTDEGTPQRMLSASRDITTRKRLEEAARDSEIVAARNRLTARIAAEINTPLASAKNSLQLLKGAIPPEHPIAKYMNWCEQELDRIEHLVRQLLAAPT